MKEKEAQPHLAEKVEADIQYLKSLSPHGLTSKELTDQIDKLQDVVKQMKKEGISVWNAQKAIPKIFDVVDGAFVVMKEIAEQVGDKDK